MKRAIIHTPDYAEFIKVFLKTLHQQPFLFCFVYSETCQFPDFSLFYSICLPPPTSFSINLRFLFCSVFTSVTSGAFCWVLSTKRMLRSTWQPRVESRCQGSQATEPGPAAQLSWEHTAGVQCLGLGPQECVSPFRPQKSALCGADPGRFLDPLLKNGEAFLLFCRKAEQLELQDKCECYTRVRLTTRFLSLCFPSAARSPWCLPPLRLSVKASVAAALPG